MNYKSQSTNSPPPSPTKHSFSLTSNALTASLFPIHLRFLDFKSYTPMNLPATCTVHYA